MSDFAIAEFDDGQEWDSTRRLVGAMPGSIQGISWVRETKSHFIHDLILSDGKGHRRMGDIRRHAGNESREKARNAALPNPPVKTGM